MLVRPYPQHIWCSSLEAISSRSPIRILLIPGSRRCFSRLLFVLFVKTPLQHAPPSHSFILDIPLPSGDSTVTYSRNCLALLQLRFPRVSNVSTRPHSKTVLVSVLSNSNSRLNVGVFPVHHFAIAHYSNQSLSLRQLTSSAAIRLPVVFRLL
jgi:hypothetical protein